MELFVVRHAIAEDAADGQRDEDRALTAEGRERFAECVEGLEELGIRFERVLHSPWKRAVQTAELLRHVSEHHEALDALAGPPGDALLAALVLHVGSEPIAVVGHQPWLGELVAWLTLGERERGEFLDLKKGGVVWLEGEPRPGGMKLRAYLPPRVLRGCR